MIIPAQIIANCRRIPEREAWLDSLPAMLKELTNRWSLRTGPPFDHANVTCSWVAPVVRADGTPAVLKLGMPHMEGAHEIQGLRFWNGDPTVQLLEADDDGCGDRDPAEAPLAKVRFAGRAAPIQALVRNVGGLAS